jgi:hypothetical protein
MSTKYKATELDKAYSPDAADLQSAAVRKLKSFIFL